jgi:PAS domain S-box-containing protein
VGLYDFKPLAFQDANGKARGFFIDILEDMAKQEKWDLTYVFGSFNQCLSRLKKGEIDLIAGIAYSEERAEAFEFTREHLFVVWAEIYTPQNSPVKTLMDLEGKHISLVKGAQVNTELKTLLEGFGISARFQEYEDYEAVLQSLEASAADAGVFTNLYGFRFLETHPVARTQIFFAPTQLRFAVGKKTGSTPIPGIIAVETLDRYFSKYKADIHSIYHRAYDLWTEPSGMPVPVPKLFIPTWGYGLFFTLTLLSLLLIGFNRLSKRLVNIKTLELRQSNDLLRIQKNALREAVNRFKKVFNSQLDAIFVLTADMPAIILECNQAANDIFGYAPGDLIGKPVDKLHEDRSHLEVFQTQLFSSIQHKGYLKQFEFSMKRKDGCIFPSEHTVVEMKADSGRQTGWISIVRNLSHIKKTESALMEAEQNYKTLFQEMLDGFALHEILCNESGEPVGYRFLEVNPAFERMTSLKAEEIAGRTVLEILPGTEPHWIQTYGKVALTGEPVFFENYAADLKKHFEVTVFQPFSNQFACIFQDITERKQAEAGGSRADETPGPLEPGPEDGIHRTAGRWGSP